MRITVTCAECGGVFPTEIMDHATMAQRRTCRCGASVLIAPNGTVTEPEPEPVVETKPAKKAATKPAKKKASK